MFLTNIYLFFCLADDCENAVFKLPTIQMPDIVEVKTGEEDEEPQFVSRAKVFLFSDKDKEWKERGVGDFKILKHVKNSKFRFLLQCREKYCDFFSFYSFFFSFFRCISNAPQKR